MMPKREDSAAKPHSYSHAQQGIVRPLLLAIAVVCLILGYFTRDHPPLMPVFLAAAVTCVILSFAFGALTVQDEGDRLAVRFGPLPFFKKTIPYGAITAVEKDRSTFLASWGIHWTRKGWLWNIGGYDCVRIKMGGKSTLIGTGDADGLVAFLVCRIGGNS